jgi:hypothetical protein
LATEPISEAGRLLKASADGAAAPPQMTTIGTESAEESRTGVTVLVALVPMTMQTSPAAAHTAAMNAHPAVGGTEIWRWRAFWSSLKVEWRQRRMPLL